MTRLVLARDFALPVEAVTQAIGVIAKRRAGKSYTARRFAEQLFKARQQIVIVDPKGDWWGIRSSADGKSPGLPVVILGGERGDIPLEVSAGEVVAKLVTEERVSALLDLSLFRKHEVATFMTAFLENLYRLKAQEAYRTPLMLFVDEADAIAPQKPQDNEARMLGAAEDIVRRGGQRGLGCTLITQRSAVLNKNVLTQVEMIVALRTIAPQDLKALDAWIEVHGEREQREILMTSLPSLPIGDAWFWSPGWPTADGIFNRVHVLPIETFDSGATPKAGEKRIEPKNLADVDLGALQRQMAATIEKAKADDPKLLKAEIVRLRRELGRKPTTNGHSTVKEKLVVDHSAVDRAVERSLAAVKTRIAGEARQIRRSLARVNAAAHEIVEALDPVIARLDTGFIEFDNVQNVLNATQPVASMAARTRSSERAIPRRMTGGELPRRAMPEPRQSPSLAVPSEGLTRPQQRILNTLAAFEQLGKPSANKSNVAVFSDASPSSSGFANNLGALRSMGLIEYPSGGLVQLTQEGRKLARIDVSFSTLVELHEAWFAKLSGPKVRILQPLIEAYPDGMERSELADRAGASATSSGYANNLGSLRSLGLIEYRAGGVYATDLLFPEGLV